MHRRQMLVALLLFVALDLSLSTMPDVSVVEGAGPVVATGLSRGRPGPAASTPMRDWFVLSLRGADVGGRVVTMRDVARVPRRPLVNHPLRATLGPAPASEEPH